MVIDFVRGIKVKQQTTKSFWGFYCTCKSFYFSCSNLKLRFIFLTPILIQNLGPLRIYNRLILRPFTITMKIFMSINFSDKTFHTRFIILQTAFKIELYNYLRNIELLFDFYR